MTGPAGPQCALLRVRAARVEDLTPLAGWEAASFPVGDRWSLAAWQAELSAGDRDVLVAELDGVLVGAVTTQTVPPTADLHRLLVAPGHRRQGIGRQLIHDAVEAARVRGARRMLLEVAYDNEAAIGLYGSYGFEQLTVRAGYYTTGADALVMKLYDVQEQR